MTTTRTKSSEQPGAAEFDSKAAAAVGWALRARYADFAREPLPARLTELLARLNAGDRPAEPQGSRSAFR